VSIPIHPTSDESALIERLRLVGLNSIITR
jgi:hypothetical protein